MGGGGQILSVILGVLGSDIFQTFSAKFFHAGHLCPCIPPATCTNSPNQPIIMKGVIQGLELWIHKVEGGRRFTYMYMS